MLTLPLELKQLWLNSESDRRISMEELTDALQSLIQKAEVEWHQCGIPLFCPLKSYWSEFDSFPFTLYDCFCFFWLWSKRWRLMGVKHPGAFTDSLLMSASPNHSMDPTSFGGMLRPGSVGPPVAVAPAMRLLLWYPGCVWCVSNTRLLQSVGCQWCRVWSLVQILQDKPLKIEIYARNVH